MLRTSPPQIDSARQPAAAEGGGEGAAGSREGAAGSGEASTRTGACSAAEGAGAKSPAVDEGPAGENCTGAAALDAAPPRTQRVPITAAIPIDGARRDCCG